MLRLLVEGASAAVGVTANHPYWSEDRQEFVPAGELREGELLRTQLGPRRVVSITHDPNHIGFVYNLETTEHVYLVGELGALVHNTCQDGDGGTPNRAPRQTAASGGEWYEHFAAKYGAQNVDWVSGSGRSIDWPKELPLPDNSQMFRVRPPKRSSTFASELESVAGARPPGGVAHHNQPLGLNGVDDGIMNGSWQFDMHQAGHDKLNGIVNRLPYGTEFRIKP